MGPVATPNAVTHAAIHAASPAVHAATIPGKAGTAAPDEAITKCIYLHRYDNAIERCCDTYRCHHLQLLNIQDMHYDIQHCTIPFRKELRQLLHGMRQRNLSEE